MLEISVPYLGSFSGSLLLIVHEQHAFQRVILVAQPAGRDDERRSDFTCNCVQADSKRPARCKGRSSGVTDYDSRSTVSPSAVHGMDSISRAGVDPLSASRFSSNFANLTDVLSALEVGINTAYGDIYVNQFRSA